MIVITPLKESLVYSNRINKNECKVAPVKRRPSATCIASQHVRSYYQQISRSKEGNGVSRFPTSKLTPKQAHRGARFVESPVHINKRTQ